jgi:ketosteroid isomerase-like protein
MTIQRILGRIALGWLEAKRSSRRGSKPRRGLLSIEVPDESGGCEGAGSSLCGMLATMIDPMSSRCSLDGRRKPSLARIAFVATLTLALAGLMAAAALAGGASSDAIDAAVWQVISETVATGDIDGMAATYHPDAVLVSAKGTVAVADQLAIWGEGMRNNRREGRTARVDFRFESRQDDEATAFERGLFRYAETNSDGVEEAVFVPFEALLVKKDGRWLMVMERQFDPSDESAWAALAH